MKRYAAAVLLATLVVAGCATLGNDEAKVEDTVDAWIAALGAKDVDGVMAQYSEDFTDYEYSNKAAMRGFFEEVKTMGYLDNLSFVTENADTEVEGAEAEMGPVSISGYFGSVTVTFKLKREAGGWLIVGQDSYGM